MDAGQGARHARHVRLYRQCIWHDHHAGNQWTAGCLISWVDGFGLIWAIVYFIFGASCPSQYKRITQEERSMIELALSGQVNQTELKTPLLRIFSSPPFLVLIVSHSVFNWGFWTLLTECPSYMKSVLGKDIKSNAVLSSLPYVSMLFMSFVFSTMSAQLNNRNCISTGTSRKLFNTIGLWIPMITIIGLGYVRADQSTLAVVLLCFTVGMSGATYLGFNMNHLDLSPNFGKKKLSAERRK
ncbi:GL10851 [Drosophila persimilis]|uniref:GL10851 n=1 Tax=Drosophila persimilis TaxID=7234 RepID=B4GDI5_DROPE|nr:GL10851 [Drosophila persimilis]